MKDAVSFLYLLVLPSLALAGGAPKTPCPTRFAGTWEYRQAAGASFDAEGERLELTCSRKGLRGLYYGLEREGDEGLFYTLVEVKELTLTGSDIGFVVPERELFSKRPQSLEEVMRKKVPSAGVTRIELHFRGRLEDQKLLLICTAEWGCPERNMVFNRSGLKDGEKE